MSKFIDITGQKFGRLVAIQRVRVNKHGKSIWQFQCDCGKLHEATSGDVRFSRTKSCGCLHDRQNFLSRTPEYSSWANMMLRCYQETSRTFSHYGGRGITVCERWHDFKNFYSDMGKRPDNTTLDRIDSSGNYEPSNCRWANSFQQSRNRSNNRKFTIAGVTLTMAEWSRKVGKSKGMIRHRMNNLGMTFEEAISTPSRYGKSRPCKELEAGKLQDEREMSLHSR